MTALFQWHKHATSYSGQSLSSHFTSQTFQDKAERDVLKIRLANFRIHSVSLVMLKHPFRITHRVTAAYYRVESWICNQQMVLEPDHHPCQLQQSLSVMVPWHFDSDYTFTWCIADIMLQLFTNRTISYSFTIRMECFK